VPSAPPTRVQLGIAVRALRTERGLSIEALAESAGMHWTYLSGIERGIRNPSWDKLGQLAVALDVELGELIRLAEEAPLSTS
jgi:transcriptional regulator with XRE-family HTH domain